MKIASTYSYLFADLIGLLVVLAAYKVAAGQRKMMLVSGLVLIPFSVLAVIHEGEYWNPIRLGGWKFGIEDIIFCFSVGSLVWLVAVWPLRSRLRMNLQRALFCRKFVSISIVAGWFSFFLFLAGLGVITTTVITQVIVVVLLLILRKELWPMALTAAVGYTMYYCGVLYTSSCIVPDFFSMWNGYNLWGPKVLGLPVDEIAWVSTFAASWSLLIAYSADARVQKVQ